MANIKNHWLITILPLLGISFWFLIAFPFANRNESYIWIAYFDHYSFLEIIQNRIPSIINYRPLAQAISWCLYHLSGGNIILVQFINYIVLCLAIWIMVSITESSNQLLIRVLYFFSGFVYISTFYYIFNLHGIFYSPILLLIALLLKTKDQILSQWKRWLFICVVLSLFHPFILVIGVAFFLGCFIEKFQFSEMKLILFLGGSLLFLIIIQLLLPIKPLFSTLNIQNFLGSMRNVEAHVVMKIFSLALCCLTPIGKPRMKQLLMAGIIIIYLPLAVLNNWPFLILLAIMISMNLILERKVAFFALLCAAVLFPFVVNSGAPTKTFILIFLLPYLLAQSVTIKVKYEWIPKATSLTILFLILICASLFRLGIKVPLVSGLVKPMLVERGKTWQLEKCISLTTATKQNARILFLQQKQENIKELGQPKNRNNFPPTKQAELDEYQRKFENSESWNARPIWYMAFGEQVSSDTLTLIYTLEEKNCKAAYVYSKKN